MTKNKFFIAAGSFALALGAFITSSSFSKKYVVASSFYFNTASGGIWTAYKGVSGTAINVTTVKGTGNIRNSRTVLAREFGGSSTQKAFAVSSGGSLTKTVFTTPISQ
jgi:hypothetical protein